MKNKPLVSDPVKKINVKEARSLWRRSLESIQRETVYISPEDALGRILAKDVRAVYPYPPYRKSPFDGYAVPGRDLSRDFTVVATIGAGEIYDRLVAPTEAVRLMTGCIVPDGCDTVIMQEHVSRCGDTIHITHPGQKSSNIIPIGEECPAGRVLFHQGTRLDSGTISALVGLGNEVLPVYRKLRILLLTSGRELVMPGLPRQKGQILNSNAFLLKHLLSKTGPYLLSFHHVTDDPAQLPDEIDIVRKLADPADVIISTGGVSVGLYDTMPNLYDALGAKCLYERITMRPGSASYGGICNRPNGKLTAILGLSGNPAAAFNAYHLLAVPVLRFLSGENELDFPIITCRLTMPIRKKNPVDRYVQGHVHFDRGQGSFTPNEVITSSALLGLAHTNGLAVIPRGTPPYQPGQDIPVILLHEL